MITMFQDFRFWCFDLIWKLFQKLPYPYHYWEFERFVKNNKREAEYLIAVIEHNAEKSA